MNIHDYIFLKQKLQNFILTYIDNDEDSETNYEDLNDYILNNQITTNRKDLYELLKLLSVIINYHHRYHEFSNKISRIFEHLKNDIKQMFSNIEIFNIFKDNLLILPFLFETQIIIFDYHIFHCIIQEVLNENDLFLYNYFSPEIKPFIPTLIEQLTKKEKEPRLIKFDDSNDKDEFDSNQLIQTIIESNSNEISTEFYEKRKKGENDSYIAELIRQDLIYDFIVYINQTNISLSNYIERSIFETNSFLIKNQKVTLIEYAAFFGSIQIFKYLILNKVEINPSLWFYAIHSRNPEIISFLEEKQNKKTDESIVFEWYKEAIKCHHNDIANYIYQQFILNQTDIECCKYYFLYYNYEMISEEFEMNHIVENVIRYDHIKLFEILFNQNQIELELKIISKKYSSFMKLYISIIK